MDWIKISDELPDKGLDVQIKFNGGHITEGFRCACHIDGCKEFRDTLMGNAFIGDVIEWKQIKNDNMKQM